MNEVQFITFDPQYAQAYIDLNRQWIEKYFKIEPMDTAQLENFRDNILKPGGQIFFLLEDGHPVGTFAMVPHGPNCFELAKMAVDQNSRGKGYGDILMQEALKWARVQKAEKVMLLSNTILEPAIALYKKHGFRTAHLGPHPDYQRCNIEMEFNFI